jgi:hypothetical protein
MLDGEGTAVDIYRSGGESMHLPPFVIVSGKSESEIQQHIQPHEDLPVFISKLNPLTDLRDQLQKALVRAERKKVSQAFFATSSAFVISLMLFVWFSGFIQSAPKEEPLILSRIEAGVPSQAVKTAKAKPTPAKQKAGLQEARGFVASELSQHVLAIAKRADDVNSMVVARAGRMSQSIE